MKALCWYGKNDVRVETVPDPKILNPRDAIIKITSTAICGSDLHLFNGYIPTMEKGDILGHEPIVTHRMRLADAPMAYETFKHKEDNCIKVVLTP